MLSTYLPSTTFHLAISHPSYKSISLNHWNMSGPVLGFIERQKEKLEKQKQERDAKQRREAPKENPNVLREALDHYVRWLNADSVDEGARFNMMSNPKGCVCPELELTKIIRGKLPNLRFTKPEVCVNESETTVSLLLHCKEERSKTLCGGKNAAKMGANSNKINNARAFVVFKIDKDTPAKFLEVEFMIDEILFEVIGPDLGNLKAGKSKLVRFDQA